LTARPKATPLPDDIPLSAVTNGDWLYMGTRETSDIQKK
jgi:hypothetical protein